MIVRAGITDTNIRWEDDFLLSGSTVGVGNGTQRVWRFTPRDPTNFQPVIANSRGGAGNVTIPAQLMIYKASRDCQLGFQQAVVRSSRTSHFGWWITQPDSAPPVAVNCSDSKESGLLTTWPLPDSL